jgi:hypothetical protein
MIVSCPPGRCHLILGLSVVDQVIARSHPDEAFKGIT